MSPTWKRLPSNTDLRFAGSTKPHEVHVNYVFFIGNEMWCTRFQQKDAISLTNPQRSIDLSVSEGKPHDGLVSGDFIFFTITDGYIVVVNKNTLKKEGVFNLNEISGKENQLGWCRGLCVSNGLIYVGFSCLRPSKFKEYGSWIIKGRRKLPARIASYCLTSKKLLQERLIGERGAAIFTVRNVGETLSTK